MEVNKEALEAMTIADLASLIHLYKSYPSIDHTPADYHLDVRIALQDELDKRIKNIFIQ